MISCVHWRFLAHNWYLRTGAKLIIIQASVWLERNSLERLVELSEHPVYSQCIRQITFGVDRLNPYVYNNGPTPCLDGRSPYPCNARDIKALYQKASDIIDEDYARLYSVEHPVIRAKRLVEHIEYQKRMERENLDISILSTALKRLPRLTRIVFNSEYRSPKCAELAMDGLGVSDFEPAWRCHVFQVGLQALSLAGQRPQRLSMTKRLENNKTQKTEYSSMPVWSFNELDVVIPQPDLCSLANELRVFHFDGFVSYPKGLFKGALGRFLENAPRLEEIQLMLPGYLVEQPIEAVLGRKPFSRLQKLFLSEMVFAQENLTHWLLLHSQSLTSIALKDIILAEGRWDRFLDSMRIRSWLSLSSIELIGNTTRDPVGLPGSWTWKYGPVPLVDYVQGKSNVNPYHRFHPGWFPELFEPT